MQEGEKEEITDLIADVAYRPIKDGGIKPGQLLKFQYANIKVTKVDRKNKRVWGVHVKLNESKNVLSHTGHDVLVQPGGSPIPFCRDCQVPINEPATEDGDKKFLDRRDEKERNQLSDGTVIEPEE